MKRGMLSIPKQQLAAAISFIPQLETNQFLIAKLQAGLQSSQEPVQILVSEDDLDLILDSLPAPGPDENQDNPLSQARQTLQLRLSELRFNQ